MGTDGEIQLDWLKLKISDIACQKTDATDVAEEIKPVYNTLNIHRRIICILQLNFSSRVFAEQKQAGAKS